MPPDEPAAVGVAGLGAMGAALARAIAAAGLPLVAWNRSPGRLEPFRAAGIDCAESAADLAARAETLIVCIDGYAATRELLAAPDVAGRLAGRTLIQVSTGTPQEARALDEWARAAGASYLDGAILAYPDEIGASALVAVAGDRRAFEIRHLGAALERGEFSEPGASIGVYSGVCDRILEHARRAGIDREIPAFVDGIYKRGMAAGLADEEVVALVKLFRRR